ncbi:MAG TPA: SH3 domain-containing protein [Terriglobales bacterium]|nr:SH3 domain-containing protein [Terriglobales bacterium]
MQLTTMSRRIFLAAVWIGLGFSPECGAAQSPPTSYRTTADVPFRAGPGANYQTITTLPKGIKVTVIGRDGHWLKVESKHGGKPGYIDEQFARLARAAQGAAAKGSPASVAGPYRTLRAVNLRSGPGAKYAVVTKIPAGIRVNIVRAEGDWLRVESKKGGKPGYLEKSAVERWKERELTTH